MRLSRLASGLAPRPLKKLLRRPHFRPALEFLEDRVNPSALFTVTNTNDTGAGSLRNAISAANVSSIPAEIYFAPGLEHKAIHLQTHDSSSSDSSTYGATAFKVSGTITIHGTGQILDALGVHRHFYVAAGGFLSLFNLELTDGVAHGGDGGEGWNGGGGGAGLGGSVFSLGSFRATACEFDLNSAIGGRGGDNPSGINGGGGGGGMFGSGDDGSGNSGGDGGGAGVTGGLGGTGAGGSGLIGGGGGGGDSTHNGGKAGFGGGGGGAGKNTSTTGLGGNSPFGGGGGGGNVRSVGGVTGGIGAFYAGDGGYGTSGGAGGGGAGLGGAVFSAAKETDFEDCTFYQNSARGGDGGTGIGNNAGGGGGGAGVGGAVFNDCGFMQIWQSTFVANSVTQGKNGGKTGAGMTGTGGTSHGSAVANYAETPVSPEPQSSSVLYMIFNIVQGNSGVDAVSNRQTGSGAASLNAGAANIVTRELSNIGGGALGSKGVITSDPKLGPLGNYGGFTNTFSLLPNSPALQAGTNEFNGLLNLDARGAARNLDHPGLGAFEVNNPLAPIGVPIDVSVMVSPKPSATATEAYVKGLYWATFSRAADTPGLNFWVAQLNAGAPRINVAGAFYNSNENRNAEVSFYYRNFLGRPADDSGLAFWRQQLQAGLDESVAMQGFLLSPEYSGKNDNSAFVNTMYYAILARPAESSGFNYWLAQLNAGTPRAVAASSFIRSQEAIDDVVASFYLTYVKQHPTATESTAARNAIVSGSTFGSVAAIVLASQDFFDLMNSANNH